MTEAEIPEQPPYCYKCQSHNHFSDECLSEAEREAKNMKWTRKAVKERDIEFIMNLLKSERYKKNGNVYCLTKSGLNNLTMEDLGNLRSMINEAIRKEVEKP